MNSSTITPPFGPPFLDVWGCLSQGVPLHLRIAERMKWLINVWQRWLWLKWNCVGFFFLYPSVFSVILLSPCVCNYALMSPQNNDDDNCSFSSLLAWPCQHKLAEFERAVPSWSCGLLFFFSLFFLSLVCLYSFWTTVFRPGFVSWAQQSLVQSKLSRRSTLRSKGRKCFGRDGVVEAREGCDA